MGEGRFRFATDEWYKALEEEVGLLLDAGGTGAPAGRFSLIESYDGGPPRSDGRQPGYRLDVQDGRAKVASGVTADDTADMVVRADYRTVAESLRLLSGPELDSLYEQAFAKGRLAVEGSDAHAPFALSHLHDRMCHRTVPEID